MNDVLKTPITLLLAFLGACAITHTALAQPKPIKAPVPQTWAEFQTSKDPADIALVAKIRKDDWWKTCIAWGREVRTRTFSRKMAGLRDFLISDHLINGIDLTAVNGSGVMIGQTTCGVYAVLGLPSSVNHTSTASRQSAQIVYRQRGIYVYTDAGPNDGNGIVRTIQN